MKVEVQRHYYNSCVNGYDPYDVPFVSEVYAINGNEFLVYDPGYYMGYPHFEWYDITDRRISEEHPGEYEYFVTLFEGETK